MKKTYCDICGNKIEEADLEPFMLFWKKDLFYDRNDHAIEDICPECFWTLWVCLNMMKETRWKPDFHEKLRSEKIWDRDIAGCILCELEKKCGLEF